MNAGSGNYKPAVRLCLLCRAHIAAQRLCICYIKVGVRNFAVIDMNGLSLRGRTSFGVGTIFKGYCPINDKAAKGSGYDV